MRSLPGGKIHYDNTNGWMTIKITLTGKTTTKCRLALSRPQDTLADCNTEWGVLQPPYFITNSDTGEVADISSSSTTYLHQLCPLNLFILNDEHRCEVDLVQRPFSIRDFARMSLRIRISGMIDVTSGSTAG